MIAGYVYATELFPTYMRAQGVSMAVASFFIFSALFTAVAPTAIASVGWKFYLGELMTLNVSHQG
jgi:hypothetical protein